MRFSTSCYKRWFSLYNWFFLFLYLCSFESQGVFSLRFVQDSTITSGSHWGHGSESFVFRSDLVLVSSEGSSREMFFYLILSIQWSIQGYISLNKFILSLTLCKKACILIPNLIVQRFRKSGVCWILDIGHWDVRTFYFKYKISVPVSIYQVREWALFSVCYYNSFCKINILLKFSLDKTVYSRRKRSVWCRVKGWKKVRV